MVRELPIVSIDGKKFYVDERLKEYRETTNPNSRIRFDELGDRKPVPVEMKPTLKQRKRRLQ